ncbi:MAG: fused MFS/spermidine synthase [Vicinamibacterales bacterium]
MLRGVFLALFAVSGAAALVYEVTWTRLLTLQMGHGVAAASTVLAAFMGGLAAGAAAGGRIGGRLSPARALATYAGLEAAIAAIALLLPLGLAATRPLLVAAYADGHGGALFGLLRLGSSLALLAVPAAAMGATFPIASRWMVRHAHQAAGDAGALYAANTVGAALGAVAAGFVLLPSLGLTGATWVGVALNLVAAGGALWVRAHLPAAGDAGAAPPAAPPAGRRRAAPAAPPGARGGRPGLAAVALGVTGFTSLTLQVVWTRLLALILGPTTYAFSTIVAVFIAGLALGSALGSRLAARARQPLAGLSVCLSASVGLAVAAAALVDWSLLSMAQAVARPGAEFGSVLTEQVLIVGALLVPMTVAFGAAFPFAVAVASRTDETVVSDLGLIYSVNTLGAIAGALLSGFVLVPWLGLHDTIRVVVVTATVAAGALALAGAAGGRGRVVAVAAAALALGAGVWLPGWNPLLLSSGAYKYAPALTGRDLQTALTAGRLLYYREGATATVAVRDLAGTRSLAIDGKVDASNAGDMLTQRMLAHVPLLLHPDPKRVAILGLGSGVTLGSALTHPIEQAVVLEISPEVVEASRFFEAENHGALADPRTRLVVGDGRTHLQLTDERYDVIVSEPSNPWMAGIASLFTRQFFTAARARLAPGGVLCQWAHTYDISGDDLRSIVATFLSVFPDGTLWLVGDGDVLLVGSDGPIGPRLAEVATAWQRPGVAEDLASVGARSPFAVLSLFIAQGAPLAAWAGGAPIQTDDRSGLEFSGPQSVFGSARDDNAEALRALARGQEPPPAVREARQSATAADWRDRGLMLLRADAVRPAYADLVRAAGADPLDAGTLDGLIRASAPARRDAETRALLTTLAADPAHQAAGLALSRLLAADGAYDQAVRIPLAQAQADPDNTAALEQLASIFADLGDADRLAPVVARLRQVAPGSEAARYYSASLLFMQGRIDLALGEAQAVTRMNPRHARAQNLAGACLASLGRPDEARTAFEASLAVEGRDPATYTNLGTLELQAGNPGRAAEYFAEALTVDPTSAPARAGLAQALGPR